MTPYPTSIPTGVPPTYSDAVFEGRQPTLQLIYDTAPIGLAFLSPDCRYIQINQRLTEICGISVDDHLGRTVRDCVPALADAVEGIVASIMRTGDPVTGVEVAGQRADQTEERFWVTYWHPHRNRDGEIVGVNVAAEEITERRRAEAALRASERQFHTLAHSIPQLVWMADASGAIYWFNNHWYEYTGRPAGEIDPHGWQAVLGARWTEALAAGSALDAELSLLGKDGMYRPFLTRVVPLRNPTGAVYGWIGTHIDISERKSSERELRRAKDAAEAALKNLRETQHSLIEAEKLAALGRLVAGVAHEINNPLGTALTIASTMEKKCRRFVDQAAHGTLKRSSLNEYVEAVRSGSAQILESLNRAAELVQSFKQVASDRNSSDLRAFDVGDLTEQVAVGLRPALPKNIVTLRVNSEQNLWMSSYPGSYGQVLTSLFLNSIAHAYPDADAAGSIDITVSAAGPNDVEIVFADDGCGMTPDVRRQAFDPFFTTRRHAGCTGLGLHIVYSVVTDRLGGSLRLTSEPGKGTQVTILLPRRATDGA
jgi:PAS domain S-box-containing protein